MSKKSKVFAALTAMMICAGMACTLQGAQDWNAKWKLTMQAWTFNHFTFFEAVDKTAALGLRYIEAYPGQKLSKDLGDATFDHNMSAASRKAVADKLERAGVRLVNYGVVALPNNEAECRKVFDFAKEMGIETIVSEPPEDAFDMIEKLVKEYNIKVAIHNHPKGSSHYWNPEAVLKVCKGRDKRIGACCDIGHWLRSGLDPVEQLKKLQGRIISLHFKDLNEKGNPGAHDVVWGTGVANIKAILAELKRQNFSGHFSFEYEYNWLNSFPEIAQSIPVFERLSAEVGETDWKWIFDGKDLNGWDGDKRFWSAKDGKIVGQTTPQAKAPYNTFLIWKGGKLKDFELKLKFKIQSGNSGVQYRSKEFDKYRVTGYQAEVEDTQGKVGFLYHEAGRGWLVNVGDMMLIDGKGNKTIVGRVGVKEDLIKAGYYHEKDWNEYDIICRGNQIEQFLNGFQTVELVDNDRITNPNDPQDRNGSSREGILALQIHAGNPMLVEFKDIRIKNLEPKYGDAVVLFNGKDLDNWQVKGDPAKSKWAVGTAAVAPGDPEHLVNTGGSGEMINLTREHGGSLDFHTKQKFGDCRIEVQVMVPKGSNSGIYVMGEYEVQVLDSFGKIKMGPGDMGAIYNAQSPPFNACKAPGQWQQYVIEWQAPRFDASGKKIKNARFIKVELNGQILYRNLEMTSNTPGGLTGKEAPEGPLMFQGNHGPVAYRNIIVKPLKK